MDNKTFTFENYTFPIDEKGYVNLWQMSSVNNTPWIRRFNVVDENISKQWLWHNIVRRSFLTKEELLEVYDKDTKKANEDLEEARRILDQALNDIRQLGIDIKHTIVQDEDVECSDNEYSAIELINRSTWTHSKIVDINRK